MSSREARLYCGTASYTSRRLDEFLSFVSRRLDKPIQTSIARGLQITLTLSVVAAITVQLRKVGLQAVLHALPHAPAYYVLFVLGYLVLPLSEFLIYRGLLPCAIPFRDLVRKRVFNEALLDYSGEAYLFMRSRTRAVGTATAIKDVNLLSGLVSNSATLLLLFLLAATGQFRLLVGPDKLSATVISIAAILMTALVIGLTVFHRRLLTLPPRAIPFVVGLHSLRLALALGLQIVQWTTILPNVPLARWGLFLTVWMLATRIPFVPNRDLLLASIGLTLSGLIAAPQPVVAGMFMTGAILSMFAHLCALVLTGGKARDQLHPAAIAPS